MTNSKMLFRSRAPWLFLLFPLVGELLFIDTIVKDVYARRRIRVIFSLLLLTLIAITFSASELLQAPLRVIPGSATIPVEISYLVAGFAALIAFLLFCIEGWARKISLEEQIEVSEDRVSLFILNPRDVFITLNRILNAAQLRRYRHDHCDNSRLASYALAILGEYLRMKVLPTPKKSQNNSAP